jgi:hypothetical protein
MWLKREEHGDQLVNLDYVVLIKHFRKDSKAELTGRGGGTLLDLGVIQGAALKHLLRVTESGGWVKLQYPDSEWIVDLNKFSRIDFSPADGEAALYGDGSIPELRFDEKAHVTAIRNKTTV